MIYGRACTLTLRAVDSCLRPRLSNLDLLQCAAERGDAALPAAKGRRMRVLIRSAHMASVLAIALLGVDAFAYGVSAMNVMRGGHTATLMNDGTVLVVGGSAPDSAHTAERYDPTRNVWRRLPGTTSVHSTPVATLLRTGKVLVVGELGDGSFSPAVDLFDPVTGQWTSARATNAVHIAPAATLLDDGRVLVSGGFTGAAFTATCEIYEPGTDSWTTVASMSVARP